ncbi:ATP-dependent DNA helicase PIF1 [Trifolium medium]|uniref:ATP-dependent DNA helicase PIF1 n=1 Tax=Trifolium medium TaxID=97028 RepID=A0A392LWI0_9FABA|nr:ATP-dependent DNA helicase PIF1 [Trifolium medium]
MEFTQATIARFNRKQKLKRTSTSKNGSSSENVAPTMDNTSCQPTSEFPGCNFENLLVNVTPMDINPTREMFKRKANRTPLSILTQDSTLTQNILQDENLNIPSKRIIIRSPKGMCYVDNVKNNSNCHSSKTTQQVNVNQLDTNRNREASKRKVGIPPLSPLTQDSVLTETNPSFVSTFTQDGIRSPNLTPEENLNIPSKRIRIPNRKYFSPVSCVTNTSKASASNLSKTTPQGSSSAHSKVTNNTPERPTASQVSNVTLQRSVQRTTKKYPLQNKYIGVQRLDFEDETVGSSNMVNNLEECKSTLYASAESEDQ